MGLTLGESAIDIAPTTGRPYPDDVPGPSRLFQHFAMVTADMDAAMVRLRAVRGWRAISVGGPRRLPPSSGGVTAFKFRDPEGHPLELIAFPEGGGAVPRIDHSAISVADTARSIAFYQALGLTVSGGSFNHGPEQDRLDGLEGARVEVTALSFPGGAGPHVELLCYQAERPAEPLALAWDNVAATRLVLSMTQGVGGLVRDPDGHGLQLEPASPTPAAQ